MNDHPAVSLSSQALTDSEERFRLLVDAVVDYAIYMLDPGGNVASWNSGAERIKGYSAQEIIGQHFSKFYTPEDLKIGLPARGLETAAKEGRFESEGWRVRRDGTKFWANVVIDAVKDDEGRLIGFAKVTRDLTERLRAQEALEQTRQQLHQAQKLEALGQLSGGVAHDFNNMLTAIISNLQLVQGSVSLQGTPRRQIEAALQAARNGASVVRQMLVFARKQSIEPMEFKVRDALEEIAALIRRSCHENVRMELEFSPDAEWIIAEPSQLQTSVLNLVLNGCDAMPGGGTLKVSTAKRRIAYHDILPPGEYVCIAVSDTGTGMTPDVLDHALEPFFTTKEVGKGTGLGLSTVYGAIRQFGGDVKITSVPGEGTTVELLLPAGMGAFRARVGDGVPGPQHQWGCLGNAPVLVPAQEDRGRAGDVPGLVERRDHAGKRLERLFVVVHPEEREAALRVGRRVEGLNRTSFALVVALPPVHELRVLLLDVRGVEEHRPAEIGGRGRRVDRAVVAALREDGEHSGVIDVRVREDHRVERRRRERKVAVPRLGFGTVALEESAVEEQRARPAGQEVLRAGHGACRAPEGHAHTRISLRGTGGCRR